MADHSKTGPFENLTKVDHSNTGHVRYSDGYCSFAFLEKNEQAKQHHCDVILSAVGKSWRWKTGWSSQGEDGAKGGERGDRALMYNFTK